MATLGKFYLPLFLLLEYAAIFFFLFDDELCYGSGSVACLMLLLLFCGKTTSLWHTFSFFFCENFPPFLLLVRCGGGRGRDGEPSDVWLVVVLHGYGALPNGLSLKRRPEIEISGWP